MRTITVSQRLHTPVDMRHINFIEADGPAESRYATYFDHAGATPFECAYEINLRASPQALTTRSISTRAPSGSAATPIAVRAGNGGLKYFA